MAGTTFPLVRGRAMRATALDGCGNVVFGPSNQVITKGFISVGMTPNNEEGESISQANANGETCILDEPAPRFLNFTVTVAFCGVDPELYSMMTGQPVVYDAAGTTAVGFRVNSQIDLSQKAFALELWSSVPQAACDASGQPSYGYFLLPYLQGGSLGDFTIENGAVNFTMTGATTKDGTAWGNGPYNVVRQTNGSAGPLNKPMDAYDHFNLEVTTVAPPTAGSDGAIALGVAATSAVAGIPATTLPANSYPPLSLATIGSLTASPTTAWTTGQYLKLRDGSKVKWNATAWVAAP